MIMILTLRKKIKIIALSLSLLLSSFFFTSEVLAQGGLELSVTPTLFEMTADPGQVWKSQVKVINSNKYPLTVYAKSVNFAPQGEGGAGKFLPVFENFTEGKTLAEWIEVSDEPITIKPESSQAIELLVEVPEDASPGGHFAAILVGTRPPEDKKKMQISTSQIVTSLFFVRVAGEVIEDGSIREFRVNERFVDAPHAEFSLRFENKGNVHVQPQGQIEITNMWGKDRGVVPINQKTHFGNVLPNSIRNFEFSWTGESSFMDIGRYKAVATLAYGQDNRQFQTSITYFYVIPWKPILIFLAGLIFSVWFITRCIKAYVRRMLALSGVDVDAYKHHEEVEAKRNLVREGDVLIQKKKSSVSDPIRFGVGDLLSKLSQANEWLGKFKVFVRFIINHKKVLASVVVLIIIIFAAWSIISNLIEPSRDYQVVIENPGQDIELSSEEIIYDSQQVNNNEVYDKTVVNEATSTTKADQLYRLEIINSSDKTGQAAILKQLLEIDGYEVSRIDSDFGESKKKSVVVFSLGYEDEAVALSQFMGGALPSARPVEEEEGVPVITIYIGNDFEAE